MTLWPGYYRNKGYLEPVLTEIPKIKIDPDQEPDTFIETSTGKYAIHSKTHINSANGGGGIEDIPAGHTLTWMYPHDEIHWILKGKAEMTYSLAGTSHTEQKTVNLEPGDIFLIPLGARLTIKVDPSGPLRRLLVSMPLPIGSSVFRPPEKK
ncbi:cupin domain-containing protein [Chloroflexota bacterium]